MKRIKCGFAISISLQTQLDSFGSFWILKLSFEVQIPQNHFLLKLPKAFSDHQSNSSQITQNETIKISLARHT